MDLTRSIDIAVSGMKAQGTRMRVVAENLANADSTADTPGGLPYRRQVVSFRNVFDRSMGVNQVEVNKVGVDESPFARRYLPGHPSADADGYVMMPNVNSVVEMMDMREAQRSYEANLNVVEVSRSMLTRTLDLLRS